MLCNWTYYKAFYSLKVLPSLDILGQNCWETASENSSPVSLPPLLSPGITSGENRGIMMLFQAFPSTTCFWRRKEDTKLLFPTAAMYLSYHQNPFAPAAYAAKGVSRLHLLSISIRIKHDKMLSHDETERSLWEISAWACLVAPLDLLWTRETTSPQRPFQILLTWLQAFPQGL